MRCATRSAASPPPSPPFAASATIRRCGRKRWASSNAASARWIASNLYRPEDDRRLTRADLEDLAQLVRPAAARGGVALDFALDLAAGEVAVGAGGVRQVLLNLLLNACEATPRGGVVEFRARLEPEALVCEIADAGPGLGAAEAARLAGQGEAPQGSRRLGLGVVVGLLGNLDARASVVERPGGGTLIRLSIPLAQAGAPA